MMRFTILLSLLIPAVAAVMNAGCSGRESHSSGKHMDQAKETALAFTRALASRDFAAAYAMTSAEYRDRTSQQAMQAEFERVVSRDWKTVGPVELGETMQEWPGKASADLAWVYLTIAGDAYSEGATVVVSREGDSSRVRTAEFGRP
jgi:hypothetical protein